MKKVLLTIIAFLLSASVAYAGCSICEGVLSENYGQRITYKLVRGLGNTLFGWTELLMRPGKEMHKGEHFATAVFIGLGNALTRTTSGVIDVLVFWNPTKEEIMTVKDCPICALE
ncbi:MAG: hypothetical protein HQ575_06210 [Candidatus Omnitrophica bacterium]|nr:hypothetical protein [Candidatus Omnitrophota bacterium]